MLYAGNTKARSVGWSVFNFKWCTKYRYKIFRKDRLKNLCQIVIVESVKIHKIEIDEIDIKPGHVYAIVKLPLTMSVSKAMNLLKGTSARLLFELYSNLRLRYRRGHILAKENLQDK